MFIDLTTKCKHEEKQFYTYMLVDPRKNEPFYIGYGQGCRCFQHFYECEGVNSLKCNIIRKISESGLKTRVHIIRYFDTAQYAKYHERYLIRKYGRRDKDEGPLANHTDGGDGLSGYVFSDESRSKLSKLRESEWADANIRSKRIESFLSSYDDTRIEYYRDLMLDRLNNRGEYDKLVLPLIDLNKSQEGRSRVSDQMYDQWQDPEWVKSLTNARKAYWDSLSDEDKSKMYLDRWSNFSDEVRETHSENTRKGLESSRNSTKEWLYNSNILIWYPDLKAVYWIDSSITELVIENKYIPLVYLGSITYNIDSVDFDNLATASRGILKGAHSINCGSYSLEESLQLLGNQQLSQLVAESISNTDLDSTWNYKSLQDGKFNDYRKHANIKLLVEASRVHLK